MSNLEPVWSVCRRAETRDGCAESEKWTELIRMLNTQEVKSVLFKQL